MIIRSGLEERKNFDDFGIPGFKGEKEKIQNTTQLLLGLGTSMQIDLRHFINIFQVTTKN